MTGQLFTKYRKDQQGMALIMAIVMIPIIAFMALLVMNNTTSDNQRSSLSHAEQEAFYAAERGIEYAANRELLLSMGTEENLVSDTDAAGNTHKSYIDVGQTEAVLQTGNITDRGPGVLPVRLAGLYGSDFGANYYDVSVTSQGPRQTQARIETQIVRLYKRDDDSVFVTTGSDR